VNALHATRRRDRRRHIAIAGALAGVVLLAACSNSGGTAGGTSGKHYKIGVFLIASAATIDQIEDGFKAGFLKETGWPADRVSFETKNAQGDASLIPSIAQQFAGSDVDLIEVLGTPAVIAQAKAEKTKPIVAVAMGDPVGGGVAKSLDEPGGNVTGSIDFVDPARILTEMLRVTPSPHTIGTIYNGANENSQVWVKALRAALAARGMPNLEEASVTSSADVNSAARSLAGKADTILIGPDIDTLSGLPAVVKVTSGAHQKLFLVGGKASTGVLATIGPDYTTLGVEAGQVAGKVANGTPAGKVAFARPTTLQWSTNASVAKDLAVTLPANVGG
jgi:putative ABC transport system substrate-binding protein